MSGRASPLRIIWHRCPSACTVTTVRPGFQTYFSSSWRSFASKAPRSAPAPKPQKRPATSRSQFDQLPKNLQPKTGGLGRLFSRVAREGEVTLFQSRSQRSYYFSAYGLSAFCFAYAVYNSNAVFRDPVTVLPMWQQALFGGICVSMSVMGTIFLVRTGNMIQSIKAVHSQGQPRIRFQVRSMLPFKKFHFEVAPSQVHISKKLVVSAESAARFESDARKLLGGSNEPMPSFVKAPVARISHGVWRIFLSVRQIFTSEDFILIKVDGQRGNFRMDSNGFVDRDFLLLGNPVKMSNSA
ncbi:uncharacterized protein N7482_009845 [Penicillium canariense]|uniref:Uncharacterized protein n=1 Tax=Penicillium canariense TaxID=189055 RepID=A0A9W9LGF3_9EURO|nr:uncharacterized protein N7482_009845 [Penicillium canariense]KAJ5153367.1 hypothetical protein N7482_009845 [Penicillium canariense]